MKIYKSVSEKKRHNLFSFVNLINEKSRENLKRQIKKLSSRKNNSSILEIEQLEQRINNLMNLEKFFPEYDKIMNKKGYKIISEISYLCSDDFFDKNKLIYRYGDDINKFYIIYQGEVELFFPYTEEVNMNIDEFYIYILRLRKYGEIEMLNNVLLLNEEKFLKEINAAFDIDFYIYRLYISFIRLKFEPSYLYQKNKIYKGNNFYSNDIINFYDTFDDREIKELILRISEEIIETIKCIMPDKMVEIIEEKKSDIVIKKIIKKDERKIKKYRMINLLNMTNCQDYYERILPIKIFNEKLESKKIIIMKYLKIGTLKKGETFGDFNPDSFSLFSQYYLDKMMITNLSLLKIHRYHNFRNMSAISSSQTRTYSFTKSMFYKYFSLYIEKKTNKKKVYLLYHPLFSGSKNTNLLKTYSLCFSEQILNERDNLIKENDSLEENNIFIYFIIKGECQLSCEKTIPQIDEVIKTFGKEEEIRNTYNQKVKDILNTRQYDELIKNPLKIKLDYLSDNDIIGLSECINGDKYFLNVNCTKNGTKVYKVDSRIIKILIDSDEIIRKNKDRILYNKYQLLCKNLINQRKIFFDSLLNEKKISLDIDTGYIPNKLKFKSLPQLYMYKSTKFVKKKNLKFINIYPKSTINKINNDKKETTLFEDLDQFIMKISHRYSLVERKIDKSNEYRKKIREKMEKIRKKKEIKIEINKIEHKQSTEKKITFDKKFGAFRKSSSLFRNIFRIVPSLKHNSLKNFEGKYELVLPYEYQKLKNSSSVSEINPLFYDDFNRSFNSSQYFNLKNDEEKDKSKEKNDSYFDYTLKLSGILDNNSKTFYNKRNLSSFIINKRNKKFKRIKIRKFKSNFK